MVKSELQSMLDVVKVYGSGSILGDVLKYSSDNEVNATVLLQRSILNNPSMISDAYINTQDGYLIDRFMSSFCHYHREKINNLHYENILLLTLDTPINSAGFRYFEDRAVGEMLNAVNFIESLIFYIETKDNNTYAIMESVKDLDLTKSKEYLIEMINALQNDSEWVDKNKVFVDAMLRLSAGLLCREACEDEAKAFLYAMNELGVDKIKISEIEKSLSIKAPTGSVLLEEIPVAKYTKDSIEWGLRERVKAINLDMGNILEVTLNMVRTENGLEVLKNLLSRELIAGKEVEEELEF